MQQPRLSFSFSFSFFVFTFALLLLLPLPACRARTVTWREGRSGRWNDPANWEPQVVPSTNQDHVDITIAGSYEVVLDSASFVTVGSLVLGNNTVISGTQEMIYPTLYSLDSYPLVSLRLVGASYLYVKNSLTIQQGGLLNLRPSFSPSSLERPKVSVEQRFVNEGGMVVGNGDISCKDFSNDGLVYSAYWLEEWGFEPFEVGRLAVEASASFLQSNRGTLAVDVVGDIPVVEHGMINLFGSSPELSGYLKAYFFDSANETDATYQVLTTELPFTTIKGLQVEYVIKVFNSDVVSNRTCTLFHQPSSAYCANDTRCSELPQEVLELYTCEHLTNTRNPTTLSGGCTQDMNFGFLLGAPEAPRCVCDKGFITDGSECIPWCEAGTGCSNHGECVAEEGIEPYCICSPGWQGTICNIADCPGTPDCMGRGRCNTAVTPVACQCIDPLLWGGAACDVWVSNSSQPNATGCPVGTGGLECSGHGECVLGEDDIPECSCEDIWEGSENCVGQCPNDCNGRGECIVTGEAPVCDCEWEWQGDSCSEARFEEDDDADEQEKIVIGTVVSSVVVLFAVVAVIGFVVYKKRREHTKLRTRSNSAVNF